MRDKIIKVYVTINEDDTVDVVIRDKTRPCELNLNTDKVTKDEMRELIADWVMDCIEDSTKDGE